MIDIKKKSPTEFDLVIDGQVVTVSPDILEAMDFAGLVGLELILSQEKAHITYQLRHYDTEKKSKKSELIDAYRAEGLKKTEAELKIEEDETYKGIKQMINSLQYTQDLIDSLIIMVRRFISMRLAEKSNILFEKILGSLTNGR